MEESEAVEQTAELVERVAAIDVAKASGMLCLRLPRERIEGRRTQRVWNVGATTNAILELGDHLLCQGVTRVVMEATSSGAVTLLSEEVPGGASGRGGAGFRPRVQGVLGRPATPVT
ncbi:hypothetical protein ACIQCF_39680 [Streptomyces sp. NPDC088353]|uniref:hypothetical protein n=1 Tax=unclassified Streptomyces TaxID=2593676 RepID=UPI00369BCC30